MSRLRFYVGMADISRRGPLFGSDVRSGAPQRLTAAETATGDQPCRGGELPAWARTRPSTKTTPSPHKIAKLSSARPDVGQDARRPLPTRLLTVAETASFFQVSEKTIRRLIDRGELPVVRLGRSVRIDPEAIEKMMVQSEQDREK